MTEDMNIKAPHYLDSIDSCDPDRKSPLNVGDTVVHRDSEWWGGRDHGPMIVLESVMLDLSDERGQGDEDHDYRFYYILLAGDEKIQRFEERLKLSDILDNQIEDPG